MAKYPNISPYAAYINNPISIIDNNGDSVARFGYFTGEFLGFFDDGKETWSFQRGYFDLEKGGEWKTKGTGLFNDAKVDVQAIRNEKITHIEVMSDAKVEKRIKISGVKLMSTGSMYTKTMFAKNQGAGSMDYGVNGIMSGDLNEHTFYVREGIAYNVGDIGNYLWGRGMAELGIDLKTVKLGAHYNNLVNGRGQTTSLYDFGPGTYGPPGFLDSKGDQNAIHRGYSNSPAGKAIIESNEEKAKGEIKSLDTEVHMTKF
jgi:hypothetical protein